MAFVFSTTERTKSAEKPLLNASVGSVISVVKEFQLILIDEQMDFYAWADKHVQLS
jgi:hypothetical protein